MGEKEPKSIYNSTRIFLVFFVGEVVHYLSAFGHLKYGFLKKLFHYQCTSCQLNISSHQNWNAVMYCIFPHSDFDEWICSTDKRCIGNEITSYEIDTLRLELGQRFV